MPVYILEPKDKKTQKPTYLVFSDSENDARKAVNIQDERVRPLAAGRPLTEDFITQNFFEDESRSSCEVFNDPSFDIEEKIDTVEISYIEENIDKRKAAITLHKNIPRTFP